MLDRGTCSAAQRCSNVPSLFALCSGSSLCLCLLPFQPPHSSVTKKPFTYKPLLLARAHNRQAIIPPISCFTISKRRISTPRPNSEDDHPVALTLSFFITVLSRI
jgi:hypothetical protein